MNIYVVVSIVSAVKTTSLPHRFHNMDVVPVLQIRRGSINMKDPTSIELQPVGSHNYAMMFNADEPVVGSYSELGQFAGYAHQYNHMNSSTHKVQN